MRVCKYKETPIFHFHNANPKGKNANDCVARAISVALTQSWEDTIREMTELGIKKGYTFNETDNIALYLLSKGWIRYSEPRDLNNKKLRVKQFLNKVQNCNGVIIATVGSHHLTLIVNGVVWDTWDCTKEIIHSYWKNPNAETPKEPEEKRRFTL